MSITVVTRTSFPSSAISQEVAAVAGSHTDVIGWSVAFTLNEGESKVLWRIMLASLVCPVIWPVRVTNIDGIEYRVSKPWILTNSGGKRRKVKPATTHTRTTQYAVVG